MSAVTLNCFQGLSIKKVDFGGCCKRRGDTEDDDAPPGRVMIIQDTALDLCVVSAPNRLLETPGVAPGGQHLAEWDFLSVDKDQRLVMMSGERQRTVGYRFDAGSADDCIDLHIAEVFAKPVTDILIPLINMCKEKKVRSCTQSSDRRV